MEVDSKILKELSSSGGFMTISDISKNLGIPSTTVSRHLAIMHASGKLGLRKVGNAKLYKVVK